VGRSYRTTIKASGGTSAYSFIVMSGSLSPGLTLTSRGALSGKPTSAGTFTFAIQARDRYGRLGTQQYDLTIALPTVSLKSINAFQPDGGPLLQQDSYSKRVQ
jgi:hypothetical protein